MAIVVDNQIGNAAFEVLIGEYDIPEIEVSGLILDIGANIGAFAVWARQRWPDSTVICYEPAAKVFEDLRDTIAKDERVTAVNVAVTSQTSPRLYHGRFRNTEACLSVRSQNDPEDYEDVASLHPAHLPPCEFLKIDAEGSEFDILSHYEHEPNGIALEWHSHDDRIRIVQLLKAKGYTVRQSPNALVNLSGNQNIGIIKAWK